MAEQTFEDRFKSQLYGKYQKCEKYLIPKEQYNQTIEEIKLAAQDSSSKSRHGYYILQK